MAEKRDFQIIIRFYRCNTLIINALLFIFHSDNFYIENQYKTPRKPALIQVFHKIIRNIIKIRNFHGKIEGWQIILKSFGAVIINM